MLFAAYGEDGKSPLYSYLIYFLPFHVVMSSSNSCAEPGWELGLRLVDGASEEFDM